jgi:hypothetical protein
MNKFKLGQTVETVKVFTEAEVKYYCNHISGDSNCKV